MADFFESQGFKVDREETDDRFVDGKVSLCNFSLEDGVLSPTLGAHEAGAIMFAQEFLNVTCHYLGLDDWWYFPSAEDLEGF